MALTTIPSELSSVSGISDSSTSTAITIDSSQNITFAGNITTGSNTISGVLSSVTGSLGSAATATTQAASDNSTKLATTAYVTTALANMVDSAPSTLNTLNELAAALGDDANFSTTVTNNIATKLPLAGGTLTGNLIGTTATFSDTVTIDAADGDADEAYVLAVRNQEATDGRNYGLWVRAGSNSSDESFSVRNHDNSATYFKVRGDGNVGIATTDIKEKLSVNGAAVFDGNHATGTNAYGAAQGVMIHAASSTGFVTAVSNGSNDVDLQLRALNGGSANSNQLVLDSEGGVGIGTSSPGRLLTLFNNDQPVFQITNNTSGTASTRGLIQYIASGSTTAIFDNQGAGSGGVFLFQQAGTERMRINSNGTIAINSTATNRELTIQAPLNGPCDVALRAGDDNDFCQLLFGDTSADNTGIVGYKNGDEYMFFNTAGSEAMRIDSSGNVNIYGTDNRPLAITSFDTVSAGAGWDLDATSSNGVVTVSTGGSERMRIDSSGNVLFGDTSATFNDTAKTVIRPNADNWVIKPSVCTSFNRTASDGDILEFYRGASSKVGSIGTLSGYLTIGDDVGILFNNANPSISAFNVSANANRDAEIDLGASNARFKDVFRSGSTYSTSDRNMKQDIRDLTDAERNVALAAKGLLKAFRFINTVEAEGDSANIHFGIIAQDLAAAFTAEGLDANDYQVYKSATTTDEDGNEQTILNVCYENLLAFIISAI